ncbi:hypothetical protein BpHYR1_005478 [Brachionus plicatilis]|uniref:Uncharacterized protein n=1 Tax=Brachionus plicatilis TaxID=10195 RepID=A0A3M7S3B5_BRAPC|nr:hypothetical protein BpHYR1_005478 [Brachionus plicatilis]
MKGQLATEKDLKTDPEPVRVTRKRNACSPRVEDPKTKKTRTFLPHKDPVLFVSQQKKSPGRPRKLIFLCVKLMGSN